MNLHECRTCKVLKPSQEFCLHLGCSHGIDIGRCKACKTLYEKARRANNYDLPRYILARAKQRAKVKGLAFDLTLADIIIPPVCPVFGTPFEVGNHATAASIDRIRSELGYVRGNICIISNRANMLKGNACAAELRAVADWLDSVA